MKEQRWETTADIIVYLPYMYICRLCMLLTVTIFTGHQSFIADLCFLGSGHHLVSIGWDSQLLLWNHLLLPSLPKITSLSRAIHHNTQHTEQSAIAALPLTEVEPMEGFKLGPSASVDFLPLTVYNFLDSGLFVLVRNRLGAVYAVLYMRSS